MDCTLYVSVYFKMESDRSQLKKEMLEVSQALLKEGLLTLRKYVLIKSFMIKLDPRVRPHPRSFKRRMYIRDLFNGRA